MPSSDTVWVLLDAQPAHKNRMLVGAYKDQATAEAVRQKLPMYLLLVPVKLDAKPQRV